MCKNQRLQSNNYKTWLLSDWHQVNPRCTVFLFQTKTNQSSQTNSRSRHQQRTAASPAAAASHTKPHRADTVQGALYHALCSLVDHNEELQAFRNQSR